MKNKEKKNFVFSILNDVTKKEKNWKTIAMVTIIGSFIVCCFCSFLSYKIIKESEEKIYVFVNDYQLEAVRSENIRESIGITTRGHINNFHELFYILQPDPAFIKKNIEKKALYLIDDSGSKLYNFLSDQKFYKDLIAGSYSTDIKKDSINVDFRKYPFHFTYYGKQKITKKKTITYRKLITSGRIRKTSSTTENNLSQFIIEDYDVIDNTDIEIVNRRQKQMNYDDF